LERVERELAIASEAPGHAQHEVPMAPVEGLESTRRFVRVTDVADRDEILVAAAIGRAHAAIIAPRRATQRA